MLYKHIVVAIDGSRTSLSALAHAASLAEISDAKMTPVNIANPSEYMYLAPEYLQNESYESAALTQGGEVLDHAEKIAREAGVKNVERYLATSTKGARDMAQQLIDYANENGADLIVLGTHGRTGLMHLLMGSFAETVMRQSTLPLLVLRGTQSEEGKGAEGKEGDKQDGESK